VTFVPNTYTLYTGTRLPDGRTSVVVLEGGVESRLIEREDIAKLSNEPFDWCPQTSKYSTRAKLALAILLDCLRDENLVIRLFQNFAWQVVETFPRKGWSIADFEIRRWVILQDLIDARRATLDTGEID